MTNGFKRSPKFENLSTIWERRKAEILKRTEKPPYPFGLPKLDKITHGIAKGKITILAARTSESKTAFALQTAFNIADAGKSVAYISLEDDRGQIAERLFSNVALVDNWLLRTNTIDPKRLDDPAVSSTFQKIPMLVLDDFGYDFLEIQYVIDSMNPKPEIVFLDYVQMIDYDVKTGEYESLSAFSRNCKKFAETNDIGLFIVSQINRKGIQDGRPAAHHLQGCGRLEQVSDLLMILYCPFIYKDGSYDHECQIDRSTKKEIVIAGMKPCPSDYTELFIAKNKNGIRGDYLRFRYTGKFYRYEEWSEPLVYSEKHYV